MGSSRKFWLGMVLGAVAGGALSLFDRSTRMSVKEDLRKVSGSVSYIAKHPDEFVNDVRETVAKVTTTVEQVTEDVAFIAEKVEEIRDVPPQLTELVHDTKETFMKMGGDEKSNLMQ